MYQTSRDLSISGFVIPKGFAFNGMTIPWFLRAFVGGEYRPRLIEGVVLHDYLYTVKKTTRKQADEIFYELIKDANCAILFYWAVRLFGWTSWKS